MASWRTRRTHRLHACSWTGCLACRQKALVEATALYSPRADVPAPAGGIPISDFKVLAPTDWDAFLKTHTQFAREWDKMTGLR